MNAPSAGPAAARGLPVDVPWRIREVLLTLVWVVVWLLGVIMGLVVVAWLAMQGMGEAVPGSFEGILDGPQAMEGVFVIQLGLMALLMWRRLFQRHAVSPRIFFLHGDPSADAGYAVRLFGVCVLISIGLAIVVTTLISGIGPLVHRDPAELIEGYFEGLERESDFLLRQDLGWRYIALIVLVVPPLEEVMYRGCLYTALRRRLGPWPANLISSGVFALSHHYVFALPNVLLIGILDAYAYERTRSLRTPILFHLLWNLFGATSIKPVLWVALVGVAGGIGVWSWRTRRAHPVAGVARATAQTQTRRTGWKVYAWCYLGWTILGGLVNPGVGMKVLFDLPVCVCVFAYAWRRPILPRAFWLGYGLFAAGLAGLELWTMTRLTELLRVYQGLVEQGVAVSWEAFVAGVFTVVVVTVLLISPAFVVMFRTARGIAAN